MIPYLGSKHSGLLGKWQKWQNIHYNEINKGVYLLNKEIWSGAFDFERAKKTWISRERFHAEKDLPTAWGAMVRFCWSFGNEGKTYIYGEKIELAKQVIHALTVADNPFFPNATQKEKRLQLKKALNHLSRIGEMQRLERLENLERLESLEMTNLDYRDVKIKPHSVVYCDIPYDTNKRHYGVDFDFAAFYEWAKTRNFPVYFSEYGCNDKRFVCVWEKEVVCKMSKSDNKGIYRTEKLFWNKVKL